MEEIYKLFESLEPFNSETIHPALKDLIRRRDIGFGKIMNPLRLIFVGSNLGPGLIDMMEVLGKEEVLYRLEVGLKYVSDLTD
jgi:glutamyl-tRNA synthetase